MARAFTVARTARIAPEVGLPVRIACTDPPEEAMMRKAGGERFQQVNPDTSAARGGVMAHHVVAPAIAEPSPSWGESADSGREVTAGRA